MHINDTARVLGSRLGETRRRQTKMARAVITLVKKAGLTKAGLGWGTAATKAWPLLRKLLPYLGMAGAGAAGVGGGYLLGRSGQPAADDMTGGAPGTKQPTWNPYEKKMFGRMNINPAEASSRQQAMEDFYGGLGHNMAFAKRREQLQRQGLGF